MNILCQQNIEKLIGIERDSNFAKYLGIEYDLRLYHEDGNILAVKYSTRDDYEKKMMVSFFSVQDELTKRIQSDINADESIMVCPIVNFTGNSDKSYFDGGFFRIKNSDCKLNYDTDAEYYHIKTLSPYIEVFRGASLPTKNVPMYLSWLDENTDEYVSFKNKSLRSILCILREPTKIVSFYWDYASHYTNIASLLIYFLRNYKNDYVYVMAPTETELTLTQYGFQKVAPWRLLYNAI